MMMNLLELDNKCIDGVDRGNVWYSAAEIVQSEEA